MGIFKASRLMMVSSLLLMPGCSMQQAMDIALSKDPKAAVKSLEQNKLSTYKQNPQVLVSDIKRLDAELDRLFGNLQQQAGKQWGSAESETLPSSKRYVKYTQQYKNRIIVDYEAATIRIEHIQEPLAAQKLRGAIVVALLTSDDPKSTDVFSDKDVILSGKPFLQDLVLDQRKQVMRTRADVERFADYLVANRLQSRRIRVADAPVEVAYVQLDMIGAEQDRIAAARPPQPPPKVSPPRLPPAKVPIKPGPPAQVAEPEGPRAADRADPNQYAAADRIAPKFLSMVNKHAEKSGVDPALIFGVIYQESRFNPHAVSQAEAYGMMQLVPKSGGLEAFRKAKGEALQPTQDYLMDPDNNIELGATYLGMILFDYWTKNVGILSAREYCTISAYNTGPGNVARAFTGSTRLLNEAQQKANGMQPDELYDYLRVNLPYAETRDYLLRVSAARRHYKQLFYSGTPERSLGE